MRAALGYAPLTPTCAMLAHRALRAIRAMWSIDSGIYDHVEADGEALEAWADDRIAKGCL